MPSGNLVVPAEWNGNRGLVSNQMAHGADPQSFLVYTDIINEQDGRRRKRPGIGSPIENVARVESSALHEFGRVDTATGVVTYYKFYGVATTILRWTGAAWVNSPLPFTPATANTTWQFLNSRNRCVAVNSAGTFYYFDGTTGPDGREWFYVGMEAPTTTAAYTLSAVDVPYSTGSVTATNNSKTVTGSGATTWVTGGAWDGKFIDIAGVRYTIDTVTVASPGVLTLNETYLGQTLSGLLYTIYIGLMDWSEPPQYAFSYYNSTTGHSTNISPVTQVTQKDQVGRTPRLTAIPFSPAHWNNGYDKIQIFRSAQNGSVLVEIDPAAGGRINNSSGAGTTSFTETANTYRDVNLTNNPAPRVSNRPPFNRTDTSRVVATSIAEWNGRIWILAPRDGGIFYSASAAEIEYGRAEECWPARNFLAITDGQSLLTVGSAPRDSLVIQTTGKDRYVSGNSILDYIDRELGTDEDGGGTLNCAVAANGSFVSFYRDKRLVDYGDPETGDIGRDVQDKLSSIGDATIRSARLFRYAYQGRKLLLLSAAVNGTMANSATLVWDYAHRCWYEWTIAFSAFAMVHETSSGGVLELWGARASDGKVFKLMTSATQDDGANFTPAMRSVQVRPFGYGKQAFFKWAKLYVNAPAQAWRLAIATDEGALPTPANFNAPTFPFQSANGKELQLPVITTAKTDGEVFQLEWVWPTANADLWIEKQIVDWSLEQDVEARQ